MEIRIGQQRQRALGHAVHVVWQAGEPGDAVFDDLGEAADLRRHDRHAARHRFQRGQAEALLDRRQEKQIRDRQQRDRIVVLAEEHDIVTESALRRLQLDGGAIRPVADDEKPGTHAVVDAPKDLERDVHALDRP